MVDNLSRGFRPVRARWLRRPPAATKEMFQHGFEIAQQARTTTALLLTAAGADEPLVSLTLPVGVQTPGAWNWPATSC